MLVLSRHRDEVIRIGDSITITIVDIRGDKVRIGIDAPKSVPVHRSEVYEAIRREGSVRPSKDESIKQWELVLDIGKTHSVLPSNFINVEKFITYLLVYLKAQVDKLFGEGYTEQRRVLNEQLQTIISYQKNFLKDE